MRLEGWAAGLMVRQRTGSGHRFASLAGDEHG